MNARSGWKVCWERTLLSGRVRLLIRQSCEVRESTARTSRCGGANACLLPLSELPMTMLDGVSAEAATLRTSIMANRHMNLVSRVISISFLFESEIQVGSTLMIFRFEPVTTGLAVGVAVTRQPELCRWLLNGGVSKTPERYSQLAAWLWASGFPEFRELSRASSRCRDKSSDWLAAAHDETLPSRRRSARARSRG